MSERIIKPTLSRQRTDTLFVKYDNQNWHVESFPSGTVIVRTNNAGLSHFYVYGPSIDPEDARDKLRHSYAEDLVKFLNIGSLPKWLNFENAIVDFSTHNIKWEDGTDITCVSNICGEEQASELFHWFLERRQAAQGAEQLADLIDADILKKMIDQAGTKVKAPILFGTPSKNSSGKGVDMLKGTKLSEWVPARELTETTGIPDPGERSNAWLAKQPKEAKLYWYNDMKCLSGSAGYISVVDDVIIDLLIMKRS